MSWKDDPKIRDLEPYCKKHGYAYVVAFCVDEAGEVFTVNTYGKTKKLCKVAGLAGDRLLALTKSGEFPQLPEEEPADDSD